MGKRVVLDTDVLIEVFEKNNKNVVKKLEEISDYYRFSTTTINVIELLWGSKNIKETIEILESLDILGLDEKTAKFAGILANKLKNEGRTPSFADCVIAAVCIMNDAILFTLNVEDFERFERFGLILLE